MQPARRSRHNAMTAKFSPVQQALLTDASGREIALPAAARSLRPRQILFARYVSMGLTYAAAVRAAGYEPSTPESAKAHGSELASDERVAELIRIYTASLLKSSAPIALAALTRILSDPKSKDADKVKAAVAVLQRSQPTKTSHQVAVEGQIEHTHAVAPKPRTLADLYLEAGIAPPAGALPPLTGNVVDAEFEVVPERLSHVHGRDVAEDPTAYASDGEPW